MLKLPYPELNCNTSTVLPPYPKRIVALASLIFFKKRKRKRNQVRKILASLLSYGKLCNV